MATRKTPSRQVGAIKAADFGSAQIKKYISGRRAEGAEDATINRETSIIRPGFSIATKEADPPLLARAPFIPKLKEDNVRQGFLEHSEYLSRPA
jgi:hypothetical protein